MTAPSAAEEPTASAPAPLQVELDERSRRLLGRMGRTEDLSFSADGGRLAIVGFGGKVFVASVRCRADAQGRPVALSLSDAVIVRIPDGLATHGVSFIDERRLAVADRERALSIVAMPAGDAGDADEVRAEVLVDITAVSPLRSPHVGAVAVSHAGGSMVDLVACDGNVHRVARHLVDISGEVPSLVDSETLLDEHVDLPDGADVSPDRRWLAVGNHELGHVVVVPFDEAGRRPGAPATSLAGITYPHGVCFAAEGRAILVTDAGRPVVHVFSREETADVDGRSSVWTERSDGHRVVRVLDEDAFRRGRTDERNGGPKGIAAHDGLGVAAITCANERFVAFALEDLVGSRSIEDARGDGAGRSSGARADDLEVRLARRLTELTASASADEERYGFDRRSLERALRLVRALERTPVWRSLLWLRYGRHARRAARARDAVYSARALAEQYPD